MQSFEKEKRERRYSDTNYNDTSPISNSKIKKDINPYKPDKSIIEEHMSEDFLSSQNKSSEKSSNISDMIESDGSGSSDGG